MSSSEYDYEGYEKSLEKVLSLSEKDYWAQYVDINRYQIGVAKTYLWVSVALIGAYVTIYDRYSSLVFGSGASIVFAIFSIVLAIGAFIWCLYATPAREGYMSIPEKSWGEFSEYANNLLNDKKNYVYTWVLTDMVDKVDAVTCYNVATNQNRADQLRTVINILIASITCASITVLLSCYNYLS